MTDADKTPGVASINASPDGKAVSKSSSNVESGAPTSSKTGTTPPAKQQTKETTNFDAPPVATTEAVVDDALLEADDDFDNDSAFGGDESDSTSIASSMLAGILENGRRYQTKREGEYWGPSDEKQFQAMQAAHIMSLILDSQHSNPHFRSPVPATAQNILDVGTGNGAWAIEVAEKYPSAYVQGIDLYPPPEVWVPPNCKFEVDDVLKPWMFMQRFDLIHFRHLIGAFTDHQWKGVYKQAYDNLVPGGWVEQVEPSPVTRCDDGTLDPNGEYASWKKVIGSATDALGKSSNLSEEMRDRIQAAGFINIQEKLYKVPVGEWAKNPILKEAGKFNKIQFAEGMEGFALFLLTKHGLPQPWSVDEVQVWLAKVRQEMNDPRVHCYMHYRRVWGQKPYDTPKNG